MIPRSRFIVTEPPRRAKWPYWAVVVGVLATAIISDGRQNAVVAGVSGEAYQIPLQKKVWRAVGPALSVRFHTTESSAFAAAAEAADLLPHFAAKADSAGLRYLVIRAYKPIVSVGDLGLYRGWNFRYERTDQGWTTSTYW